MNKKYRGIACIINVFKVHGMAPRNGTEVDCHRLQRLFEKLHFRVRVFNDEDGLHAEVRYLFLSECIDTVLLVSIQYTS